MQALHEQVATLRFELENAKEDSMESAARQFAEEQARAAKQRIGGLEADKRAAQEKFLSLQERCLGLTQELQALREEAAAEKRDLEKRNAEVGSSRGGRVVAWCTILGLDSGKAWCCWRF